MQHFVFLFIAIFKIVCYFNIFNKCNEKGWKAIIPILDKYTMFKLFYKKRSFIIYMAFVVALIFAITMMATCGLELIKYYDGGDPYSIEWMNNIPQNLVNATSIFFLMFLICVIALFVFEVILNYHLAKSFNKSNLFALGLIFLNVIFLAILAFFNENQYIGNTKENNQNIIY